MLADIFWAVASSNVVLIALALLTLAALLVGHVPFGAYMPVIAPYVVLARASAYVFLALLFLLIGFRIADERAAVKQLKTELAWSNNQIAQQKASAEDAERLAREASARADQLNEKVNSYAAILAKRSSGDCTLDDDDVKRLLDIAR